MKAKWMILCAIILSFVAVIFVEEGCRRREPSEKTPGTQNSKSWTEMLDVDPQINCAELHYPNFWKRIELPEGKYEVTLTELDVTSGGFPHIKSGTGNIETDAYDQQFARVGQKYTYIGPTYIAGYFIDAKGTLGDNSGKAIFKVRKIK